VNPQIWWYIARASGIIAWLFITAAVLWGIMLSTKLFPEHRRPAWLLDLHRMLGALSVLFLATHVGALIADSYIQFDIVDILVPFASDWKTWQVALGVFAFWGVVIVEATSLAMRRLPKKVWRGIHFTSYATFLLTSLHGTFAGTDATNKMYVTTSIVTTAALVAAVVYRIMTRRSARPTKPRPRPLAPMPVSANGDDLP
jgi:DMSO/TMAO reductase YedYZ heme-binding membrane subunit